MTYFLLLLEMAARFFVVGLFSVGGGLATLPFLEKMGQATGWFGPADVSNMVAISESTPGPMGINMATFVGHQVAGIPGSIIAPLALVLPSVVIIMGISVILQKFRQSKIVDAAFYGLRAASVGLIGSAFFSVTKLAFYNGGVLDSFASILNVFNVPCIVLACVMFVVCKVFKKVHPIFIIVICAVIGIVLKM